MFGQLAISLVLFAVATAVALPIKWPNDILFAVSAAVAVAAIAAVPIAGRVPALPAGMLGEEGRTAGLAAFRSVLFRRFVITEAAALVGLATAFVLGSAVPYLVNGAVAVLLMALFVVPTRRLVADAESRLDSEGGQSQLSAALGVQ
jgi:hypothetical protein